MLAVSMRRIVHYSRQKEHRDIASASATASSWQSTNTNDGGEQNAPDLGPELRGWELELG